MPSRLHRVKAQQQQQQQGQHHLPPAQPQPPIELPLLDSACSIVADATYYAARPLLAPSTQIRLARRALKSKSATNVRVANATYSTLFFDPGAHAALTPLTVESDAQSLLFVLQRVQALTQRLQQLVAVFDPLGATAGSILQVFQGCVLDLWQLVQHARRTLCKAPLLLCGPAAPNTHLLLQVRDWAADAVKERCAGAVDAIRSRQAAREQEQQKQRNSSTAGADATAATTTTTTETARSHKEEMLAEAERAVLAAAGSRCLLFSDCAGTIAPGGGDADAVARRREVAKAAAWLAHEEVPYIADALRELIARWTTHRGIGLLACYGGVVEQPPPGASAVMASAAAAATVPAMNSSRQQQQQFASASVARSEGGRSSSAAPSSSGVGRADDGPSGVRDDDEDDVVRQLQLSLQRMQLFLGNKVTRNDWLQLQQQQQQRGAQPAKEEATSWRNSSGNGGGGGDEGDSVLLKQHLKHRFQQMLAPLVPEHIARSAKFAALPITDRMELITTYRAIANVFFLWRSWLRRRRERTSRIDALMRKNGVVHCLWRMRVWAQRTAQTRAARRATYGVIDRSRGAAGVGEYALSHSDAAVQTVAHAPSRFFLKMTA